MRQEHTLNGTSVHFRAWHKKTFRLWDSLSEPIQLLAFFFTGRKLENPWETHADMHRNSEQLSIEPGTLELWGSNAHSIVLIFTSIRSHYRHRIIQFGNLLRFSEFNFVLFEMSISSSSSTFRRDLSWVSALHNLFVCFPAPQRCTSWASEWKLSSTTVYIGYT